MEHRIKLTPQEAFELSKKLQFLDVDFVQDDYTGEKRIRHDPEGTREKIYQTPVLGTICRFSANCKLGDIENVWFEVKWTKDEVQFEIEFESDIPVEFQSRPNIAGWSILQH